MLDKGHEAHDYVAQHKGALKTFPGLLVKKAELANRDLSLATNPRTVPSFTLSHLELLRQLDRAIKQKLHDAVRDAAEMCHITIATLRTFYANLFFRCDEPDWPNTLEAQGLANLLKRNYVLDTAYGVFSVTSTLYMAVLARSLAKVAGVQKEIPGLGVYRSNANNLVAQEQRTVASPRLQA